MAKSDLLSPELLRKLLRYQPETGKLFWLRRDSNQFPCDRIANSWNARCAGKEAFTADNGVGYRIGAVFGIKLKAHRVCWAIAKGRWPEGEIDHINGIKSDNRLCNLRDATRSQNQHNRGAYANNESGFKGVHWSKSKNGWGAQISIHGKSAWLGLFDTPEAAHAAYCKASAELHGEFGRVK
jgi:hypothetical protein